MADRKQIAQQFADRLAMRSERMRAELDQEEVPILGGKRYPEALARASDAVDAMLLEEVVYARHAPVHEGLRPRYGCVIVADLTPLVDAEPSVREISDHDPWNIRPMVDGSTTILVRDLEGRLAIMSADVADELALVDLLATVKGVSVQRLSDGRLRIGTRSGIALNDGGDWSLRPAPGSVIRELTINLALPEAKRLSRMVEIRRLLELCFHSLSPHGIGATIIVNLSGGATDLFGGITDGGEEPATPLNVFRRKDQALLRNVLAYEDGACLVDRDGNLRRYASKLNFTEEAVSVVKEHGGSRHTSAKRFSFDHPSALAVVVSADGPITLFCGGTKVTRIDRDTARGSWIDTSSAEVRARVESERESATCGGCGTAHLVELMLDEETGEHGMIACQVCEAPLLERDGVLDSRVRVIRPWE